MTKYERENLGNGISIPCMHMDLTGAADSPARKELGEEIHGIVGEQGALLLRDTGLEAIHGFSEFLSSIGYNQLSYVGGTSPRTDKGKGVYTATDIPGDVTIVIHQEMSYLDSIPDYISFFCEVPPETGQKTNLIADMRRFTERLPVEFKQRYQGKRGRLRRKLPTTGKNTGFYRDHKCWQESLGTDDRDEAVATAEQRGWEVSWTDDDFLVITQEPARFFRTHPIHGEIWCNQAMLFQPETSRLIAERDGRTQQVEWLESAMVDAPDSLDRVIMEDGSAVPREDCRIWFEMAVAEGTPYALERGDIIVLDNMLMAHGRSTFTGPRKIFTSLGDRMASSQLG